MDATQSLERSPEIYRKYAVILGFSAALSEAFNQFYQETLAICMSEAYFDLGPAERGRMLIAEYTTLSDLGPVERKRMLIAEYATLCKIFCKQYEILFGSLLNSYNIYVNSPSHTFSIPSMSPSLQRQNLEVYLKSMEAERRQMATISARQASGSAASLAKQPTISPVNPANACSLLQASSSLRKLTPLIKKLEVMIQEMSILTSNHRIDDANFQILEDSLEKISKIPTFFMAHNEESYRRHLMQSIPPVSTASEASTLQHTHSQHAATPVDNANKSQQPDPAHSMTIRSILS